MVSETNRTARALERHLFIPVLIAALASVPAVLLTLWGEGLAADIGHGVNWLAGIVLWGEWIVLLLLAKDKLEWIRTHKWTTFVVLLTIPAVVFALGPTQVLRAVRAVGALRIIRVTRIVEAGSVLRRRMGLSGPWGLALLGTATATAAAVAGLILADPTSASRQYAESLLEDVGVWPAVAAGAVLAAATAIVAYHRLRPRSPARSREEARD